MPGRAVVRDDLGLYVDECEAEDHVGVLVGHALDHGGAVGDPARFEVDDRGIRVARGREDPHALHHCAAGRDRPHVLEWEAGRELALELGLHRQLPAVAEDLVLERGARIVRDRSGS